MRNAALSLCLFAGCSGKVVQAVPPFIEFAAPESLILIGRFGMAHACPVEGAILTAAHVAVKVWDYEIQTPLYYVWSQDPHLGYAHGEMPAPARDLAMLVIDFGELPNFARAAQRSEPGEKIYWYEYAKDESLKHEKTRGRLEEVSAGHFSFSPAPKPGASGGCVYNENGEVLGVVVWRIGQVNQSGVAVDITWP